MRLKIIGLRLRLSKRALERIKRLKAEAAKEIERVAKTEPEQKQVDIKTHRLH